MFNHNLENQIKQIEKEFFQIMINNLKNSQSILPFSSFNDFKKKIGEFVLKHLYYQKIYLPILKTEKKTKEILLKKINLTKH